MATDRYIKLSVEENYGTEDTNPEDFYLDAASCDIQPPDPQANYWDGIGAHGERLSNLADYIPSGGLVTAADAKNAIALLAVFCGKDTVTAAGDLHKHLLEFVTVPGSLHLTRGMETYGHVFGGSVPNNLTIELSDNFLQFSSDMETSKDYREDLESLQSSVFPADVYTALEMTLKQNDEDVSDHIDGLTINLDAPNDLEERIPVTQRFPTSLPRRQRVDGTMELVYRFDDEEQLQNFWGVEEGPLEKGCLPTFSFDIEFEQECTTEQPPTLKFAFPRLEAQSISQSYSGRDRIEQTLVFKILHDDDTNEMFHIAAENSLSSAYL